MLGFLAGVQSFEVGYVLGASGEALVKDQGFAPDEIHSGSSHNRLDPAGPRLVVEEP